MSRRQFKYCQICGKECGEYSELVTKLRKILKDKDITFGSTPKHTLHVILNKLKEKSK